MTATATKRRKVPIDAHVYRRGNLFVFSLNTPAAHKWVAENVETEGWQWMGARLAVDQDCALNLVRGMLAAGLKVA